MEIINKKQLNKVALDENVKAFVVHVISFSLNSMPIYSAQKVQIVLLVIEEVQIPSKYLDLSDIFLEKKALVLLMATDLNKHAIKLQKSLQSLYRPIYSLWFVKLKMFKIYIKTNLTNYFI